MQGLASVPDLMLKIKSVSGGLEECGRKHSWAHFKELILELTAYNSRMLYVISTTDVMFYVSASFKFGV